MEVDLLVDSGVERLDGLIGSGRPLAAKATCGGAVSLRS
jgi:hypothetical protein